MQDKRPLGPTGTLLTVQEAALKAERETRRPWTGLKRLVRAVRDAADDERLR